MLVLLGTKIKRVDITSIESTFKFSTFARPSNILSNNSRSFILLSTRFYLDSKSFIWLWNLRSFSTCLSICFFLASIFRERVLSSHSFSTRTSSMLWIFVSFVLSSCMCSPIKSFVKESSASLTKEMEF